MYANPGSCLSKLSKVLLVHCSLQRPLHACLSFCASKLKRRVGLLQSCCHTGSARPQACMAYANGEMVVAEYGSARPVATCQPAAFSPALLSLRLAHMPGDAPGVGMYTQTGNGQLPGALGGASGRQDALNMITCAQVLAHLL